MPPRRLIAAAVSALLTIVGPGASAATHCTETITRAILHLNGNIYFNSDKTCPNWCQVNWGTSERNKNALAMLLTAKTSARPITFYWPNLPACTEINATYASPDYMMLE